MKNFDVKGHGIIAHKNKDFIEKKIHKNHAFSYGRIRFIYHLFPELSVNYELYIEESSQSMPYDYGNKILGYFQGVYESYLLDTFYLKFIVGDLKRVTFGSGLTYKEYEAKGIFYKASDKDLYVQYYGMGTGYILNTDIHSFSIGWKDYINLNLIWINTDDKAKAKSSNEFIVTVNSEINILKWITFYSEVGRELLLNKKESFKLKNGKFRTAGLSGLSGFYANNYFKTTLNLEIRGYEKRFNTFHNTYTDSDYTRIEVRDKSINNWRNYFTFPGKVFGFFIKFVNDIKIIYKFYYNLDVEFLRLKYNKSAYNLYVYQTGIKYAFSDHIEAFFGVGNRNLQVPVFFTYELSANPFFYTYFKFKF